MTLRMFPSYVYIKHQGRSALHHDAIVYHVEIHGKHVIYRVHEDGRTEICEGGCTFHDTVFPVGDLFS